MKESLIVILIVVLCATFVFPQKSQPYPINAGEVIALAELFSQKDFSGADAVKLLGKIDEENYDVTDWSFQLIPFPSERERIKAITIDTYDERRKVDAVGIEYVKPLLVSYGTLKQKYGKPDLLTPPIVNCQSGGNCRPAFVGYEFKLDRKKTDFAEKVEVFISLEMEWSKTVPKHADKDLLKVKSIRFKRNVLDED